MRAIIRSKAKELLNNYTTENSHEYEKRFALATIDCIIEELLSLPKGNEDAYNTQLLFWEEVKKYIKSQ